MKYYSYQFAQAYGEGAYSSGTYSCTLEQERAGICTVGTTGGGSNGSGLADTGLAITAIVTLACLFIFIALIVRIWRRPRTVVQEVEVHQPRQPEQDDPSQQ